MVQISRKYFSINIFEIYTKKFLSENYSPQQKAPKRTKLVTYKASLSICYENIMEAKLKATIIPDLILFSI